MDEFDHYIIRISSNLQNQMELRGHQWLGVLGVTFSKGTSICEGGRFSPRRLPLGSRSPHLNEFTNSGRIEPHGRHERPGSGNQICRDATVYPIVHMHIVGWKL
jgi:hypothetical protein